ncbi:hypothetical protein [Methylobacterium iners]|uniref:Phage tail assembly protein n=1 Tax=Methylobacterium iners TaxID=418707 RepID=A0ABQ4RUI9_9HYPH|nr:hypothetical protein [Methylobacterium iners]GJD93348.1 hypothetical protein OCOJLMKI_0541 [Methylobacterium iners]
MSGPANHRPTRPLSEYPTAELPPPPPEGALGEAASATLPTAAEPPPPAEVAILRFLDPGSISKEVPIRYAFEWEGREVRSIQVRRLAVAEVGAVIAAMPEGMPYDLYLFLAAMTGLPAPVLRGLIDDDGAELLAAARPFLPRIVEEMFYSPSSAPGASTPSLRPEG